MADIDHDVRDVLGRVLGVDPEIIEPGELVQELPNVDSNVYLEAIVALEEHFGVEFPDAVIPRLERVSDIVDAVTDALHVHGGTARPAAL